MLISCCFINLCCGFPSSEILISDFSHYAILLGYKFDDLYSDAYITIENEIWFGLF